MAICPDTFQPCVDDLCYGSGCLRLPGEPMLVPCPGCNVLVAADGSDREDCDCGPDDEEDD